MWAWNIYLSLCVDGSPLWLCPALGGGSWLCSDLSRRPSCSKHLARGGSPGTWQSVSGEHLAGCRCPALVWAAPSDFRRLSFLVEDSTDVVGELCKRAQFNIFKISSDPNPTRSQKALLVMACLYWRILWVCVYDQKKTILKFSFPA